MFLVKWFLKYISQKIFRENKWNKFGTEDPYHDVYEVEQRSFFGSKTVKKIKKPKGIPAGISKNDEMVLKKVIRRAYHLDMLFSWFGYRIGFAGIIGVIPVAGDLAGVIFSLLLFNEARQVDGGLPIETQLKFLGNIVIDFLIGLIPIFGDFVEVLYKANSRNALILEKHLKEKGVRALAGKALAEEKTQAVLADSSSLAPSSSVANSPIPRKRISSLGSAKKSKIPQPKPFVPIQRADDIPGYRPYKNPRDY